MAETSGWQTIVLSEGGAVPFSAPTTAPPLAQVPGFSEFNIGHAIVSRALFTGLVEAVAEMKRLVRYDGHDPKGIRGNRPPRR